LSAYADASFLTSVYAKDVNTSIALRRTREQTSGIFLSSFAEVELFNALELRHFRHEADNVQTIQAWKLMTSDIELGWLRRRSVPERSYETAKHLSQKWTSSMGTRAGDVLHVAIALELQVDWFLTFDKRQLQLAHAEGLKT
jgi:Predicted nucleic acid-binding protein, contains PIN domain